MPDDDAPNGRPAEGPLSLEKNRADYPTSSCYRKHDVRGIGTHKAGHVFGLDDLYGNDDNLTMYGTPSYCKTRARNLGLGDVRGLRSIY
ncbi:hypothetical protein ACWIGY_37720 [Streptomyces anulatus]